MKIITTILIIIFLLAIVLVGAMAGKIFLGDIFKSEDTAEKQPLIEEKEDRPQIDADDIDEGQKSEEEEEMDQLAIESIEIYLDGNKEDGIFLGRAKYGLTSKEAYSIYGEDFSESGYMFAINTKDYDFVPGSIHYLYVYIYIPEYGWEYIRKKVIVEGETDRSSSIELHIDKPAQNGIIKSGDVQVYGWSVDAIVNDNTGINRIEVYLNGPKGFGKFLGEADYGIERPDVANVTGNANYINSGYQFNLDAAGLEPGSENTLYIYSFSDSGTDFFHIRDFFIEGEGKESHAVVSVEAELNSDSIIISGWALNENMILEGKPADPNQEYSTKKIVFTSDINGNEDIFSMDLDGSNVTQLTDHPGNDKYPAVSTDGKKIAYTSDIGGHWQIFIMDWDGANKMQLTSTPVRSGFPGWSFDGRYIFYEVYKDGDWELYRINTDGSHIKRITFNAGANDWHPFPHPYKYKVLFESGVSGHEDLYIMDFNGDNIQKLSDTEMRKRVPSMSKDGTIIVFTSYDENNRYFILTMDQNGENIVRLTGTPINSGHPSVSPDNKYIAFQARTNEGSNINDIYIINIDGSNLIQLTSLAGNEGDPIFMFQVSE